MYKPKRKKEDEDGLLNYFGRLDREIDDVFGAIKKGKGDDDDDDGKKDDKKDNAKDKKQEDKPDKA